MKVLSVFSGIGAHDLGLEWAGFQIAGQIEIDEYCQEILKKHWAKVPKWRDVCRVTANDIRRRCGRVELITGGFPCQDISTAGKQAGIAEGERSSLWWEMWRLIRDLRPDWLLLENVPALRTNGADAVLSSLEAIGYTCWPLVVGAWHAGAPHKRNRVWIIAYRNSARLQEQRRKPISQEQLGTVCFESNAQGDIWGTSRNERSDAFDWGNTEPEPERFGSIDSRGQIQLGEEMAREQLSSAKPERNSRAKTKPDTNSSKLRNKSGRSSRQSRKDKAGLGKDSHRWTRPAWADVEQYDWEEPRAAKSEVGGTVHGIPRRLALKALGNANPPIMAYLAGRAIMDAREKLSL